MPPYTHTVSKYEVYIHSKTGNIYVVIGFAKDHETTNRKVLYKNINDLSDENVDPWDRPEGEWLDEVIVHGKATTRFSMIADSIEDLYMRLLRSTQ